MGRPKKVTNPEGIEDVVVVQELGITKLSLDYPSEGLNDMARKINEIVDHLNEI